MIGFDLDNTIACYDAVFREEAVATGLVAPEWRGSREWLRCVIRDTHGDQAWAALQARVYGPALERAAPYPGALTCIRALLRAGRPLAIVSHKTRVAAADPSCDLHEHAWRWLDRCGLVGAAPDGVPRDLIFFEATRDAKIQRIATLGCSHFVDDLPEVFDHPEFPTRTTQVLFDPDAGAPASADRVIVRHWQDMLEYFLARDRH